MKKYLSYVLLLGLWTGAAAQAPYTPEFAGKHHRQFDFWIGAWDVTLRVQQDDGSWEDRRKAEAHVYPILDGKAILELWQETSPGNDITGFSIRYFRQEQDQWEIWLNWPGPDRSGTSYLTGSFRHGRGEFFSTRPIDNATELISRYSFSDITKNSLRWDDAYSRDGGRTWSNKWIMEFDRRRSSPPTIRPGLRLNTYGEGGRCSLPGFSLLDNWAGEMTGEVEYYDGSRWRRSPATLQGYPVLDGCAVITFLSFQRDGKTHKSFGFHTFNTYANQLEYGYLDNEPGNPFQTFFGEEQNGRIEMDGYDLRENAATDQRFVWTVEEDGLSFEVFEGADGEWTAVSRGRFSR